MKIYYLKRGTNFGDHINLVVFNKIFNQDIQYSSPNKCEYIGMGSILDHALFKNLKNDNIIKNIIRNKWKILSYLSIYNKPIFTLGSGFIQNPYDRIESPKIFRKVTPIALRGKKTKECLEKITGEKYNIALGDAGIFIDHFIKDETITKKYKVGIVPHMEEKELPIIKNINNDDIKVIDIEDDYMNVIRTIAECDTILSSSMHGLIAADSLNIPNMWIKISNKLIGDDFKFLDYYSTYNKEYTFKAKDLQKDNLINISKNDIINEYKLTIEDINTYKINLKNALNKHFNI